MWNVAICTYMIMYVPRPTKPWKFPGFGWTHTTAELVLNLLFYTFFGFRVGLEKATQIPQNHVK